MKKFFLFLVFSLSFLVFSSLFSISVSYAAEVIIEAPNSANYDTKITVIVRNCRENTNRCAVQLWDGNNNMVKQLYCDADYCPRDFYMPKWGPSPATISVLNNEGNLLVEKEISLTGTPAPTPTPTLPPTGCVTPQGWDEALGNYCQPWQPKVECKRDNLLLWCCPSATACQEQLKRSPLPPTRSFQPTYCVPNDPQSGIQTALGCIPTGNTTGFIAWILKFAIGIGGGIAFILMLIGVFQIITSSGDPERLKAGKELITSALIGLLMIIFSLFLLQLIGVQILQIPGF